MATQKIYNKKLNMEIQVHVSENCYRNYQRSLELAWVHQVGENLYSSHQKKKKRKRINSVPNCRIGKISVKYFS